MPNEEENNVVEMEDEEEDEQEQNEMQSILLEMAHLQFLLTTSDDDFPADKKLLVKQQLMDYVTKNYMGPWYDYLCATYGWEKDEALREKMTKKNTADLEKLEKQREDAVQHRGDVEVREAMLAKAEYLAEIGDKEGAVAQYEITLEKTVGSGEKIDVVFALIRLGLCWSDGALTKSSIAQAKILVEKGGDWERRNLLGVYAATYNMIRRQFKDAADALLTSVATFTCYKLFSFNSLVFYSVISSLVALDRNTIKKKVINCPDILTVIDDVPFLRQLVFSFYECDYGAFFQAFAAISRSIRTDMYLSHHCGFIMREIRIVAYTQFLESYKSVKLESMAASFGLSAAFLDKELSRFIACDRLNCKLDSVRGIVETNRPDIRNIQYSDSIKQGDLLLNQIQKLTKMAHY